MNSHVGIVKNRGEMSKNEKEDQATQQQVGPCRLLRAWPRNI